MRTFLSSPRFRAIINVIGAMLHSIATPMTCVLLVTGSLILTLIWVFLDFFAGLFIIDLYGWLPLVVLLAIIALLMTKHWKQTAANFAFVLAVLCILYYLLLGVGTLHFIQSSILIPGAMLFLLLLNGGMFWLTGRQKKVRRSPGQPGIQLKRRAYLSLLTRGVDSVAVGALFTKLYIWDDPSKKWLLADLLPYDDDHKLTLAPPYGKVLEDASHLNKSMVAEIRAPQTTDEVIQAIKDAKVTGKKISLSGIRHSMGGQALGNQTLHLDMTHMDRVKYDPVTKTITVGPGATWKQVQQNLSEQGRAVRVMQDSNIFSVGGTLSVNAHGKDPQFGSFIEGVEAFKIVTADGQELVCDATHHQDLFLAAIGGFGLFGVITEVTLRTTENSLYDFSMFLTQTNSLIETLEKLSNDTRNRLVEAHLSVDAEHFLSEGLVYVYAESGSTEKPQDDLEGENNTWLRKVVFQASRTSNFGKLFRWEMEKHISPLVEPKKLSRNTAMAVPVRFLENPDPHSTDILQEYFIPIAESNAFLTTYKNLIKKYQINLLNVTIRKVRKDTQALVSYAQDDMYGFVVYYKVHRNSAEVENLKAFTQELIEHLIAIKATYYLCYGGYYTQPQLIAMYPEISLLLALKNQKDPDGLFTNIWYEKLQSGDLR